MGTRNLTAVMIDGEYKVAQYGKWDGYPSGQGATALDFLRNMDRPAFTDAVRDCRWITKDEHKEMWLSETGIDLDASGGLVSMEQSNRFAAKHPQLNRDMAADVLGYIQKNGPQVLKNNIGFAGDSLFCEYAYVIDLDKNTFEIFKGFNHNPITEGRFVSGDESLDVTDGYGPVTLLKSYSLDALPTEDEFLADLSEDDDE